MTARDWRWSLVVACLATVSGCVDRGTQAEAYFGSDVWKVMEKAETLDAYRLAPPWIDQKAGPMVKGGGLIFTAKLDPGEEWLKLYALLQDPKSYDWNVTYESSRPEVLFRFIDGNGRSVDVLLCFNNSSISVDYSTNWKNTKWVSTKPARDLFVQMVQRVFTQDQFVQSLESGVSMPQIKR